MSDEINWVSSSLHNINANILFDSFFHPRVQKKNIATINLPRVGADSGLFLPVNSKSDACEPTHVIKIRFMF